MPLRRNPDRPHAFADRQRSKTARALLALTLLLATSIAAAATEPVRPDGLLRASPRESFPSSRFGSITETVPMLNFTVGEVGVADDLGQPGRYGIEYRFEAQSRWRLIPAIGASAAENGATFFYADLRHELWLTRHWMVIPSFGLGWFQESDELRLGHDLQFRSGIEFAYRFRNNYRVGAALFHLSNGGISEENPGTESIVLSLCIPLRRVS